MKNLIIEELAKNNTIRDIIANVAKDVTDPDLQDLEQDIYLELLEKDDEKIEKLYENKQLNYFITKMVINNIFSKTSRFYYKYKINSKKTIPFDDIKETEDGNWNIKGRD